MSLTEKIRNVRLFVVTGVPNKMNLLLVVCISFKIIKLWLQDVPLDLLSWLWLIFSIFFMQPVY